MKWHLVAAAGIVSCALTCATAQAPPGDSAVFVVTHVDAEPDYTKPALALLVKEAADSKADPGLERYEALEELSRPNHFTIVQVWRSQKDFDRHVATDHCKEFRSKLAPMLGSPFDERFHAAIR